MRGGRCRRNSKKVAGKNRKKKQERRKKIEKSKYNRMYEAILPEEIPFTGKKREDNDSDIQMWERMQGRTILERRE